MEKIRTSFFIKKDKKNGKGESAIYTKLRNIRSETSVFTGLWITHSRWTSTKRLTNTRIASENNIRLRLSEIEMKIQESWREWNGINNSLDLDPFKQFLKDPETNRVVYIKQADSLIKLFEFHLELVKKKVEIGDNQDDTRKKVARALGYVLEMIKYNYGVEDYRLSKLNLLFAENHFHFLRTIKKHDNNTALKDIDFVKSAINTGVAHGWIPNNPLNQFFRRKEIKVTEYLTDEEIKKIENHVFSTERLGVVRDIFMFGIYTGYAFRDIINLTPRHIFKKEDGRDYLVKKRIKTQNSVPQPCEVPILPPVKRLIDKYSKNSKCISNGKLLPDLSNSTLNEYLKEIQTLCGIEKKLNFHLARHTFATTITLAKGVSIEVVARMLGHKRLTTTQHYAKLLNGRLFTETEKLHEIYK